MTREDAIQFLTDTGISPEHIMELVEALSSSEKPNKWIPASERYPEDGQRMLVDYCDEDAGIMLIRFNVNGYHGFKAWMLLPKPYKASPTVAEKEVQDADSR